MRRFATLVLSLLVLAPAAVSQSVSPDVSARFSEPAPAATRQLVADTLYNQLDRGGAGTGFALSNDFASDLNVGFDSYMADDFTVPAGETWRIGEITIAGFYSVADEGSFNQNETFKVIIWDDDSGEPGNEVFRADAVEPANNPAGDLTLGLIDFVFDDPEDESDAPVTLGEGTYWLTIQANTDFGAQDGTLFLWAATNTDRSALGSLFHAWNYGEGGEFEVGPCSQGWAPYSAECNFDIDGNAVPDDGTNGNLTFALIAAEDGEPDAIADARAAGDGVTVTVEGVVTRSEGAFTYLQDETGGLVIRQTSGAFFDQVTANTIRTGSVVRVTGTLSQFNNLLQINEGALASYEVTGQTDVPEPQEVTLAEIAANGEAYEGELVTVADVTFAGLDQTTGQFAAATTYQVTDPSDASNAVVVRVPNAGDTTIDGTDFLGNPATVTGVVGQFSSGAADAGYQILLLQVGDVLSANVAVGEGPEGALGLGALAPNPSAATAELAVSLATAGPAVLAVFDVLGREVARVLDGPLAAGDHTVRVDVSALPAGTYLARLTAGGATVARPFTVAR